MKRNWWKYLIVVLVISGADAILASLKTTETAARIEGVPLNKFVDFDGVQKVEIVTDSSTIELNAESILNSNLTLIEDQFMIVDPELSRKDWIAVVKEIRTK